MQNRPRRAGPLSPFHLLPVPWPHSHWQNTEGEAGRGGWTRAETLALASRGPPCTCLPTCEAGVRSEPPSEGVVGN